MDRKYRSEAMEPIYENALANFEIGAISEERFREYERACFVPETPDIESASSSSVMGIPVPAYASKA